MQNLEKILTRVSKPARYVGGEINAVKKDWANTPIRVLLSYPDAYEVGMSNLGIQILYDLINQQADALAERTFAPWPDMEDEMRKANLSLFSLENQKTAKEFGLWGFSMQHELTYTNFLNMLDLAGLKLRVQDRDESDPLIFAGGPCTLSPVPLSPFFDFILIGEAEEAILEIIEVFKTKRDKPRAEKLAALAKIDGVWVPSLSQAHVKMRKIKNLDQAYYPTKPLVPNLDVVHSRAVLEIMRGCPRGCRFCQAGWTLKPVRPRSAKLLADCARCLIDNTGYEELSLVSLSSSDYPRIDELAKQLADELKKKKVNIAFPSLRLNSFSVNLVKNILKVRSSNMTVAPEAGTQRLRDVIRKDLTEEDILEGAQTAFSGGINGLKLYFMLGLPTETDEDVLAIAELSKKILKIGREVNKRAKVTVNLSTFVPKPHTPLQWEQQISLEEILTKQKMIKDALKKSKAIKINWHQADLSFIEGIFARGDAAAADLLEAAFKVGAKFDAWGDQFRWEPWQKALETSGIDPKNYLRARDTSEKLPWDFIDTGIAKEILVREKGKAFKGP